MRPLFELIVSAVPAPQGSLENPFLMHAATISYDDYVGRQACGRILEGIVKKGQQVVHIDETGNQSKFTISTHPRLFGPGESGNGRSRRRRYCQPFWHP